ncbi:hypothetical protein WR25_21082 [Diploscapter pachys]|uniref:RNA helicase n=1 Tax=Diploscapter pachys TaxID=2018661 RepID=A0A2A2KFD4_9BILA|nr:hypothetical protein WR25_21082 [Diploscapter pachys]
MLMPRGNAPSRIASKYSNFHGQGTLLSGELPAEEKISFPTVAKAIESAKLDDRFAGLKPIIRQVGRVHFDRPKEEIRMLREIMDEMKVYPCIEDTEVAIPDPFTSFEAAFCDYPSIMREIKKNGFTLPSPIQAQMWPLLMNGQDTIGISQTGSGKTLAFLLPAFLHIDAQYAQYRPGEKKPCPSVLVLSPTRELAQQIESEVQKYSYNNYRSVCLYGGAAREDQMAVCRAGVEIVIATPGRLADLASAGVIDLNRVTYVVLDEADRMLDMGFEPSIRRILFEIRPDRIVALTSATWPEAVRTLARSYTKEAVMCVIGSLDLTACAKVRQTIEEVRPENRFNRTMEIVDCLSNMFQDNFKVIVFVKSKVLADHLSSDLVLKGIDAQGLHGGRSQSDRENSLAQLRDGTIRILIATDLASRGIDVPDITHVINYDFPGDIEEYVHRVGRTGRAGRTGEAISFVSWSDRMHFTPLISILEKSGQEVPYWLREYANRYEYRKANGQEQPRKFFRRNNKDNFQTNY